MLFFSSLEWNNIVPNNYRSNWFSYPKNIKVFRCRRDLASVGPIDDKRLFRKSYRGDKTTQRNIHQTIYHKLLAKTKAPIEELLAPLKEVLSPLSWTRPCCRMRRASLLEYGGAVLVGRSWEVSMPDRETGRCCGCRRPLEQRTSSRIYRGTQDIAAYIHEIWLVCVSICFAIIKL